MWAIMFYSTNFSHRYLGFGQVLKEEDLLADRYSSFFCVYLINGNHMKYRKNPVLISLANYSHLL